MTNTAFSGFIQISEGVSLGELHAKARNIRAFPDVILDQSEYSLSVGAFEYRFSTEEKPEGFSLARLEHFLVWLQINPLGLWQSARKSRQLKGEGFIVHTSNHLEKDAVLYNGNYFRSERDDDGKLYVTLGFSLNSRESQVYNLWVRQVAKAPVVVRVVPDDVVEIPEFSGPLSHFLHKLGLKGSTVLDPSLANQSFTTKAGECRIDFLHYNEVYSPTVLISEPEVREQMKVNKQRSADLVHLVCYVARHLQSLKSGPIVSLDAGVQCRLIRQSAIAPEQVLLEPYQQTFLQDDYNNRYLLLSR